MEDSRLASGWKLRVVTEAVGSVPLSSWVQWHSMPTAGESGFQDDRALCELWAVSLAASPLLLPQSQTTQAPPAALLRCPGVKWICGICSVEFGSSTWLIHHFLSFVYFPP